jgi:DNA (cytosine-5)-methyltransferase 1
VRDLVLSIFPGIDILGRAFEEAGYCVVRGPDVIWGGDVRTFHPPAGVFSGVIGGPPCQMWSALAPLVRANGHEPRFGNLIPEFERVVFEAQPAWFLMENVPAAPIPDVAGYQLHVFKLNNRWIGGEQHRLRRFCFGTRDGRRLDIDVAALEPALSYHAVTSSDGGRGVPMQRYSGRLVKSGMAVTSTMGGRRMTDDGNTSHALAQKQYTLEDAAELQGLPRDVLAEAPFTKAGKLQAIANGVPMPTGRAIAQAIRRVLA